MTPLMIYSGYGKMTEVKQNENGNYVVSFFVDGQWTHETVSNNLHEAQRLAEGYVNHVGKPKLLSESA
jgi:hypothetical protein